MKTSSVLYGVILITAFFGLNITAQASFVTFQGGTASETAWRNAVGSYSIETFESYAAGTAISTLSSIQLQLDPLVGTTQPSIYNHGIANTPSGTKHLALFSNGTPTTGFQYVDMVVRPTAGTDIYSFGFWNGDPQGNMVVSIFDTTDTLIGTITGLINTGNASAFSNSFAGFISSAPIGYLVFEGNTGDGFNHVDDLQVSFTSPVPIPAAVWLFSSGLIGLVGVARRRRS